MHSVLAYIDPGSGSLAIQAVIAALVAAPFVLRNQISRFVNRLRGGQATAAAAAKDVEPPGVTAGDARADPSSWRDPSGFVFRRGGTLYRQVNRVAIDEWTALEGSGFLTRLQADGLLIPHETVPLELAADRSRAATVIRPEPIPLVSYPYEWTFGQLKAAALLTLEMQQRAVAAGFTLRDASAYNVQFREARPILIDTLSFRRGMAGAPWAAYRQFCEHFLAPLALMARRDIRLGGLLRDHLDGIPLDLAASLLPARTRLSLGLGSHVHLHARAQRRHANRPASAATTDGTAMSPTRQAALLDSLVRVISGLDWEPEGTEWADYGVSSSYDEPSAAAKDALVDQAIRLLAPSVVWDLGANAGRYATIAARHVDRVVAFDIDPAASERHWRSIVERRETRVLPLLQDLADPSPAIGWDGRERLSLFERAEDATLMALALVHHLAIGRNVPLPMLSATLARLGDGLILEWVPKDDPMVQRLLASREDIFPGYTEAGLRSAFEPAWTIVDRLPVSGTPRVLLVMRRSS